MDSSKIISFNNNDISFDNGENIIKEESHTEPINEKLKLLINAENTRSPISTEKGSLCSLLNFAIKTNVLLTFNKDFDICKEYIIAIAK